MTLLERVSVLIRANLNDLIDRAEDPQKMLKQVILDMQNQLLEVKTQVAIAIAGEDVLRKKQQENTEKHTEWMRKAEVAAGKKQDDLARRALEQALGYRNLAENFEREIANQKDQAEHLKSALRQLERKLAEAQATSALLIAKHRRSRALTRASRARLETADQSNFGAFERMKDKVQGEEALGQALAGMANENTEEKLAALDRDDEVERLLAEMKARHGIA